MRLVSCFLRQSHDASPLEDGGQRSEAEGTPRGAGRASASPLGQYEPLKMAGPPGPLAPHRWAGRPGRHLLTPDSTLPEASPPPESYACSLGGSWRGVPGTVIPRKPLIPSAWKICGAGAGTQEESCTATPLGIWAQMCLSPPTPPTHSLGSKLADVRWGCSEKKTPALGMEVPPTEHPRCLPQAQPPHPGFTWCYTEKQPTPQHAGGPEEVSPSPFR